MGSRLLLDIDGVLVRDKAVLDHVRNNVIRYVNKKLPGSDSKRHSASRLNNLMYRAYGHTARGLQKEYGVDTSDFDDFVYTPQVLNHLFDFLRTSDTFRDDARVVRGLVYRGWEVELFSNSPRCWSELVQDAIGDIRDGGPYSKPDIETYLRVHDDKQIVLVDDKMCNLMPALFFPNWTPIHFSGDVPETQFLKTVKSIYDLTAVLQKSN